MEEDIELTKAKIRKGWRDIYFALVEAGTTVVSDETRGRVQTVNDIDVTDIIKIKLTSQNRRFVICPTVILAQHCGRERRYAWIDEKGAFPTKKIVQNLLDEVHYFTRLKERQAERERTRKLASKRVGEVCALLGMPKVYHGELAHLSGYEVNLVAVGEDLRFRSLYIKLDCSVQQAREVLSLVRSWNKKQEDEK